MAWVTPTNVATGDVLTASTWNQDIVSNAAELAPFFGAWTSYTPTLTNCTAPVTRAKYLKVGRWVTFDVLLTLTGAQVSGLIGISLPFSSASYTGLVDEHTGFSVMLLDKGTAAYFGGALYASATRADLYVQNGSATYTFFSSTSSTIPHTWASTDQIRLSGTYEATS